MKNKYQKSIFVTSLIGILNLATVFSQSTSNNNTWAAGKFLGFTNTNGINPLYIVTNGVPRMHINGNTGLTAGFIGIGTSNPLAPIHIFGTQQQNAQGWRRGIILGNSSALVWDGGGGQSFFMAHPSSSPNGNWYAGLQNGLDASSAVGYAMTISVNSNIGTVNPFGSTQFFKNVLVFEGGFARRFGVNTVNPQRATEIYSNTAQMRLSYGANVSATAIPSIFTDFQTNQFGNLQIMPTGQRVGVNLAINPSVVLDINGDVRIRNVQTATPNSILIGVNANGATDVNVRRLDFTGNANQVLLGNGTWGVAPNAVTGNNGISISSGAASLGLPCTSSNLQHFLNGFNASRAINLNSYSLWMFSEANQNGGVGFGSRTGGICGVGNTVEINANNQSAYGNTNASGLRLTKLTSNSPTISSGINGVNNSKVLTVDQNGDVVLTDASSSVDIGNYCGETANLLMQNYEVPLNDKNYFFSGNGGNRKNLVAIGYECSQPIDTKLDVLQMGYWRYHISPTSGIDFSFAGKFLASTTNADYGIGVTGGANTPGINYGVFGSALNGVENWAGYFNGDVFTTSSYQTSDRNLKKNIKDYKSANELLSQLRPVSYYFRTDEYPNFNLDERSQIGLISQEVEQVFPSAVKDVTSMPQFNKNGEIEYDAVKFKAISYEKFIPILIAGHQEQGNTIDSLQSVNDSLKIQITDLNNRLSQLENCLSGILPLLCQLSNSQIEKTREEVQQELHSVIDIKLNNGTVIVLNQNVPNPFAESTVITFIIPENVQDAQIIFQDATGSLIKMVDVRERGTGQINVYANDLSSGLYTYTLVVDGKVVATKRMVKK